LTHALLKPGHKSRVTRQSITAGFQTDPGDAPSPGPTRIAKLIQLFASPVDGKVVGAARALDRVLTCAGGFHHLADVVEAHWRAPIVVPPEPKPGWQIPAARLLQYPNILLGNRESDVLQNKQRSRIAPTDKPWKWLGDIEARLRSSEQRMAS
jgi:hypothetical protein